MSTSDIPKGAQSAGDMKVGGDGETISAQSGGKRSAWLSHVKKTMRANKGMKLKQVLKLAKKSYKKTMRGGNKGGIGGTALPLSGGRRHKKGTRSRKH